MNFLQAIKMDFLLTNMSSSAFAMFGMSNQQKPRCSALLNPTKCTFTLGSKIKTNLTREVLVRDMGHGTKLLEIR